VGRETITQSSS